jgi:AcrR family transcriptional regulator
MQALHFVAASQNPSSKRGLAQMHDIEPKVPSLLTDSSPADDAEARKRIIDTAVRIVDRRGAAQTTVSDVANAVGIARRSVYRYFAGNEELFTAVAEVALGSFIAQVENITADMDVTGQLVEVVAYIIERRPHEPQLALLLANDRSHAFSRTMLAPSEIARCRAILQHTHIDWAALGYDDLRSSLRVFTSSIVSSAV